MLQYFSANNYIEASAQRRFGNVGTNDFVALHTKLLDLFLQHIHANAMTGTTLQISM